MGAWVGQNRGSKPTFPYPNNSAGTILQIPPGLMRNDFYPRKIAEYVTAAQLHELGEDRILERDRSFNQSGVGELESEMRARALLKKQSSKASAAAEKALRESEEPGPAVLDLLSVRVLWHLNQVLTTAC